MSNCRALVWLKGSVFFCSAILIWSAKREYYSNPNSIESARNELFGRVGESRTLCKIHIDFVHSTLSFSLSGWLKVLIRWIVCFPCTVGRFISRRWFAGIPARCQLLLVVMNKSTTTVCGALHSHPENVWMYKKWTCHYWQSCMRSFEVCGVIGLRASVLTHKNATQIWQSVNLLSKSITGNIGFAVNRCLIEFQLKETDYYRANSRQRRKFNHRENLTVLHEHLKTDASAYCIPLLSNTTICNLPSWFQRWKESFSKI